MPTRSPEMPPMGKPAEKKEPTHAQEAIAHQEFFLNNPSSGKYKEQPHDIIIGVHESKCRTCGEKWPKKTDS